MTDPELFLPGQTTILPKMSNQIGPQRDPYLPPPAVVDWLLKQDWSNAMDFSRSGWERGSGRFIWREHSSGHEAVFAIGRDEFGQIQLSSESLEILRQDEKTRAKNGGWIFDRTPTKQETKDGLVLIPVGNGSTSATILAELVCKGQPWAPFYSDPGKFEI